MEAEAPGGFFILSFPKTFLFLAAGPFVLVLWTASRRLMLPNVAIPSFISGFLWLPLYTGAAWASIAFLRMGRPARVSTGLAGLFLIMALPAIAEYVFVFKVYAWLARKPADPRPAGS